MKAERISGRVTSIDDVGAGIRILRLTLDNARRLDFRAGQYVTLTFAGFPARPYSIASAPETGDLEFHIRSSGGGGASDYACARLQLGESVGVEGPFGQSTLKDRQRPLLAIAGGLGLAPMKAIVESALTGGMKAPVYLYHGARHEEDLYLSDHFRTLARSHGNFHFIPVLSEPGAGWAGRSGDIAPAVAADFEDLSSFQAFLAGPPPMVAQAAGLLLDRNIPREHIYSDAFSEKIT